jgi:hypothetical protein
MLVFNGTFSNISAISWRSVLVMEEENTKNMSITDLTKKTTLDEPSYSRKVSCSLFA